MWFFSCYRWVSTSLTRSLMISTLLYVDYSVLVTRLFVPLHVDIRYKSKVKLSNWRDCVRWTTPLSVTFQIVIYISSFLPLFFLPFGTEVSLHKIKRRGFKLSPSVSTGNVAKLFPRIFYLWENGKELGSYWRNLALSESSDKNETRVTTDTRFKIPKLESIGNPFVLLLWTLIK